jgi:hypothetical protein
MVCHTPTSSPPISGSWILPSLTYSATVAIVTLSGDLTGHLSVIPRWPHERRGRPANYIVSPQQSTTYSLIYLSPSRRTRLQPIAYSQLYEGIHLQARAYLPLCLFLATAKVQTLGCNDSDAASSGDEAVPMPLAAHPTRTLCPNLTLTTRAQRYIQRVSPHRAFWRPQETLRTPAPLPGRLTRDTHVVRSAVIAPRRGGGDHAQTDREVPLPARGWNTPSSPQLHP